MSERECHGHSGSGSKELPSPKPRACCLLTHRGAAILLLLRDSQKSELKLPALILPKFRLIPPVERQLGSLLTLLPKAAELGGLEDPVHPAGSLMVWPSPWSVTLLWNLKCTDAAPGGVLSAPAVHFMGQMTSQWKEYYFSESSMAVEPGRGSG